MFLELAKYTLFQVIVYNMQNENLLFNFKKQMPVS